jgi:hypothetical protein
VTPTCLALCHQVLLTELTATVATLTASQSLHPSGSSSPCFNSPSPRNAGTAASSGLQGPSVSGDMPKALADKCRGLIRKEVLRRPMLVSQGQNKSSFKRKSAEFTCISAEPAQLAFDEVFKVICERSDSGLVWAILAPSMNQTMGVYAPRIFDNIITFEFYYCVCVRIMAGTTINGADKGPL